MWPRSENLQAISSEWHQERLNARKNAFSIDEFSEIEQTKYDLDTAGITGEDNPRTYTTERPLDDVGGGMKDGVDVRKLKDR